jgi:hypothetical protein
VALTLGLVGTRLRGGEDENEQHSKIRNDFSELHDEILPVIVLCS